MQNHASKNTFDDFVEAINNHNVDAICALMTDNHRFVDSQGNETAGKETMRAGWTGYFQLFPDYKIEVTTVFAEGETFGAFGFAGAAFKGLSDVKDNCWRLPASWKAVIKGDKIDFWQVYADAKIPYDIIEKNRKR